MRTTKPITTISFNTPEFLELKLNELVKNKVLSFWAFIRHNPEEDEGGKKHHQHVYVVPSKMLQTDDLRDELKEFDPHNLKKPLGCLLWNTSKFDEWYLYALHDKRYLASKGQARKFEYLPEDFKTSDSDDLFALSSGINRLHLTVYDEMLGAQKDGLTFEQFFQRGTTPIQLIRQYQVAWELLLTPQTFRNGRSTHSPIDTDLNINVQSIPPIDSEL